MVELVSLLLLITSKQLLINLLNHICHQVQSVPAPQAQSQTRKE